MRQDNVYDVDVKVVLLPNLLDVDIFMALILDWVWVSGFADALFLTESTLYDVGQQFQCSDPR